MDFDFSNKLNKKQIARLKKIGVRLAIFLGIIALILFVGVPILQWLTEYIWMDTLGFENVFMTILESKIILGVSGFIVFAVTMYVTLYFIRKAYINHFDTRQMVSIVANKKSSNLLMIGIALLFGFIGSAIVKGIGWEPALKVMNYESFNQTDPHFGLDVSFYMFVLPFIKFILFVLLGLAVFYLLVGLGAYSVFQLYKRSRLAQFHLGAILAVIGLILAGIHVLAPYETLLTNYVNIFQKSVVHGMSYTDKLVNIPKAYILAGVALLGSIWMIISIYRGKLEAMLIPIVLYVLLVVLGQGASFVVQNFIVSPNEFAREEPYLQHNLDFTRAAYGLEAIEVKEHPGNDSLSEELIENNALTLDNVRLNDSRPLLDIYNQIQTIRTYYRFNDMDIDRYKVDGKYEQVFVGARELSMDDLPDQAQTWVNRNLRYTHGYGVAMSHVNDVTSQGQPEYMIKDLPPEGDIDIERPQIYFGEEEYPDVIVGTKVDEFDYPTGDANETHRFEESTGVPLKGLNKLLFAIDAASVRMFVSDQLTDESQLLKNRNIMDRVNEIAPFFDYDDDPYIVVRDDGSLTWIIDAYVTGERYPYAEAHDQNENYIRNSVKVAIDAYSGEVDYYIADEEDPLLQTYKNMFPTLFTEDVPDDITEHFRYPQKLFKVQSSMYGTYHMSNLEVFYNREDYWQTPTEKYFDEDVDMEPYYITMKLPENDHEEFILMQPYTPKKRQNMISWMGVRNDGDHYGELFVYTFPKQKNIYGPQQIENRINQDTYISQQLNLWSQGGSEVIRGNLLAIPIEDTILYVEPVYIESSNETSLPEVKQVIMAYGEHIVMEETFDESLESILKLVEKKGGGISQDPDEVEDGEGVEDPSDGSGDKMDAENDESSEELPILDADETLTEISALFEAYKEALADGGWEEAAEIMTEIETRLQLSE